MSESGDTPEEFDGKPGSWRDAFDKTLTSLEAGFEDKEVTKIKVIATVKIILFRKTCQYDDERPWVVDKSTLICRNFLGIS
jgi:hypothetical protein